MATHVSISGPEAADRLAIRELVDAYAHCADRRDAKGQMSLFANDTHFVVFMDARSEKPSMEFKRRENLAPVFDELNKYETTTHFMGQSTVNQMEIVPLEKHTALPIMCWHRRGNGLFLLPLFVIMMSSQKSKESGFLLNASSWLIRD